MEITTDTIKTLRDETGVSIMQCKKALEEAKGDMDKARMALRKQSGEIAAKKGSRTLLAGVVASYIHADGSVGVLLELACETDFVAKNEEFKKLAHEVAMHVAAMNPKYNRLENVTKEDRAKATAFFEDEVAKLDKSGPMKARILEGKLDTYFKEQTLMEQTYIRNPDMTVGDMISGAVQKFGEKTEVVRFVRFAVGK